MEIKHTKKELGPLLKEDALVLQSIIRATNPKVLVEFGYFIGTSARAMLEVMDEDAVLHSVDNTRDHDITDPRFIFHKESQEKFKPSGNIDFVFLDASHDYELNWKTFLNIKDNLSDKAIIVVHDTGTWAGGNVFGADYGHADELGNWIHCPDELKFVNYISTTFPNFQQIHLHSSSEVRHGMTLLQLYKRL